MPNIRTVLGGLTGLLLAANAANANGGTLSIWPPGTYITSPEVLNAGGYNQITLSNGRAYLSPVFLSLGQKVTALAVFGGNPTFKMALYSSLAPNGLPSKLLAITSEVTISSQPGAATNVPLISPYTAQETGWFWVAIEPKDSMALFYLFILGVYH
jgi:hypothetical protein